MKQWNEEHCSTEPEELQLIADSTYIQRKDIHEVEHEETEETPAYTEWVCQSREISVSEYEMLKAIEEIQTDKAVAVAIDDYTSELIEGGVLG